MCFSTAPKLAAPIDSLTQYDDTLCKDLGLNSRRKSNFFAELFAPYKPQDFNGFIDEYLAKKTDDCQL